MALILNEGIESDHGILATYFKITLAEQLDGSAAVSIYGWQGKEKSDSGKLPILTSSKKFDSSYGIFDYELLDEKKINSKQRAYELMKKTKAFLNSEDDL